WRYQNVSRAAKLLHIDQTLLRWDFNGGVGDPKVTVGCYVRNPSTLPLRGTAAFACKISYTALQSEFLNAWTAQDPDLKSSVQHDIDSGKAGPKELAVHHFLSRGSSTPLMSTTEPVIWDNNNVPPPKTLIIR